MTGFIYKISNNKDGKIYIGKSTYSSIDKLYNRYRREIKYSNRYRYIIRTLVKHGIENFTFEIIEDGIPEGEINNKEIAYIASYGANKEGIGYNLTIGGEGTVGLKWTAERSEKQSKRMKGLFVGENHPCYGRKLPPEMINKIIESNKRRKGTKRGPPSEETRKKSSESHKGQISCWKGKNPPHMNGENNTNYRKVDLPLFKDAINKGMSAKEICKLFDISRACFDNKLKEFNLKEIHVKTKPKFHRLNRVITFKGESRSIAEWGRFTGINPGTLLSRLKSNWSEELTLTTPVKPKRRRNEKIS